MGLSCYLSHSELCFPKGCCVSPSVSRLLLFVFPAKYVKPHFSWILNDGSWKKVNWDCFRVKPHIRTDPLFVLTFPAILRSNKNQFAQRFAQIRSFIRTVVKFTSLQASKTQACLALRFTGCQNCTKEKLYNNRRS